MLLFTPILLLLFDPLNHSSKVQLRVGSSLLLTMAEVAPWMVLQNIRDSALTYTTSDYV